MHRNNYILILIMILLAVCSSSANAASLWLNGNDLYSSQGAARNYQPGDIITIKISESTSAQSKATTKTEKESTTVCEDEFEGVWQGCNLQIYKFS